MPTPLRRAPGSTVFQRASLLMAMRSISGLTGLMNQPLAPALLARSIAWPGLRTGAAASIVGVR